MVYLVAAINFFSVLLWLFLLQGDGKALTSPAFSFLYPSDRTVVGGSGLSHLVVELNQPAKISVRFNGKPLTDAKVAEKVYPVPQNAPHVSPWYGVYHYPLRLQFGLNRIEVEAVEGEKSLSLEKREIFFFSPIAPDKEIPQGFVSVPFHRAAKAGDKCLGCHLLEPQKADRSPPSPKDSSCYVCHKELVRFKQVHGPASLWNCLACHDPGSTPAKYATPVPVRDLCYRCHTDQKNYFFSSKYQHGPTATGMCTICHNPHASDHEFWLKKAPWDLCTTCHAEKASGRHIIAWGPSGDTHPTRGRPDPMKPEREFSCRSCHNPHASNSPKLWNFDATTAYQLCWTCHRK